MNIGYATPRTLEEACGLLDDDGAHALAGGVAFTMALTKGQVDPASIVSLVHLRGLHGVRHDDGGLSIGALTTHGELLRNPALASYDPLLREMFADVGNVRVRASGTLGGNLAYADPRHDPSPLFAALGARVAVQSATGTRRIPLEDLATGPFATVLRRGELLTAIELPARPDGLRTGWCKLQSNSLDDYATVSVAVAYQPVQGRAAAVRIFVGAADTHVHPLAASAVLAGAPVDAEGTIDPDAVAAAADVLAAEIRPAPSHRGSEDHQRQLARVALVRALRRAAVGGRAASTSGVANTGGKP